MDDSVRMDSALPEAPTVLIEHLGNGIATVRLNRITVRNALNLAMRRRLADTFRTLSGEEEVRCIVLSGSGASFCAGADLNEYLHATPRDIQSRRMDLLWAAIADCPKPVIAAVRGYALGGGCELAMHADIIVAAASARFGQPEVRVGLMPGSGGTQRLTRAVGKFVAMRMLLTGHPLTADEALRSGLVSTVVPDDALEVERMRLATEVAAMPPIAVRQIKKLVLASENLVLNAGLRMERAAFQRLFSTADKTEGIAAFLGKRAPRFTGN